MIGSVSQFIHVGGNQASVRMAYKTEYVLYCTSVAEEYCT